MNKTVNIAKMLIENQIIRYIFFGGLTTAVDFFVYLICTMAMGIDYKMATALAWFFAVLFAYITNKIFVFKSFSLDIKSVFKEIALFFASRVGTGTLVLILMVFCVDRLGINDILSKVIVSVINIVLNYVLSKVIIFKKQENKPYENEKL